MSSRDNYTFANHSSIPANLGPKLSAFIRSWDDTHSQENRYLSLSAPDGELVFGPTSAKGRDAIRALRDAMIHPTNGPVVNLQHTLGKCFVLAGGGAEHEGRQEIIVNGSIWYELKNGRRVYADFASFMVFVDTGHGELQAAFYEVYLDSLGWMTAIKEMDE
ncbi:hypothetical protein A1O1_00284 [Capronia coronata CBS 617.96]|uniref:SnoaL-like domain-containing protein n=1 Tax=Capronia coronata CBS 617.96 TaxID=1182541 RepID=W9YZN9_9EURO|nr:uncharacterized protein A1O1_00284 [Capronia coronata CBS 617.96]EXJ95165.1 hypothetical protein A1O1_00284 [Capronia coronata CBS 617.96]